MAHDLINSHSAKEKKKCIVQITRKRGIVLLMNKYTLTLGIFSINFKPESNKHFAEKLKVSLL